MRIVSLLASATEIVCALGAGEIAGRGSHDATTRTGCGGSPPCSDPHSMCRFRVEELMRRFGAGSKVGRTDVLRPIAELIDELGRIC